MPNHGLAVLYIIIMIYLVAVVSSLIRILGACDPFTECCLNTQLRSVALDSNTHYSKLMKFTRAVVTGTKVSGNFLKAYTVYGGCIYRGNIFHTV